jgi:hypothetical protein
MQPIEPFHHLGLLSLATIIVGLGYILRRWGKKSVLSLSSHAARQRPSRVIFAICLSLSIALFTLFTFGWLIPTYKLGVGYGFVLAASLACALVAALVPDGGGRESQIHGVAAWTMAVGMLALVVGLLLAPGLGVFAKFFLAIITSYLVIDWILFLFVRWSRRYFLVFQASYVLCFYLAALVAAYFG